MKNLIALLFVGFATNLICAQETKYDLTLLNDKSYTSAYTNKSSGDTKSTPIYTNGLNSDEDIDLNNILSESFDNIVRFSPSENISKFIPAISIKTNLIYDACYIPTYGMTSIANIGFEYFPKKADNRITYNFDIEFPMWRNYTTHKFMQIYNYTFSVRRYFKTQEIYAKGLYASAYINAGKFGIGTSGTKGWQGEGLGAGLGLGYKIPLSKCICDSRWVIDLGCTFGFFQAKYDPYVYGYDGTGWYYYDYDGEASSFLKRNHKFNWVGPTRVYISISYNIFNRNK